MNGVTTSTCVLALATLVPTTAPAAAQQPPSLHQRVVARLERVESELVEIRRDLHRHPEVSGSEERTARVVADRLRALGLEVRTGIGGHGVVGLLAGGRPGTVVAFRADMDAVPSPAPDPVDFSSLEPGVRHICGHDIHTTVGLAIAEGLSAVRDELQGTVMFLFQPAEENATGARAMLADGVFATTKPAAIFGYHTAPLVVGQIATATTTLMPGRDRIRVSIHGSGDLAAIATAVRQALADVATIPPQQILQPTADADFILAQIGEATASDEGELVVSATLVTATPAARNRVRQTMERRLAELRRDGLDLELDYQERAVAGVTNDPDLVRAASASARAVLGEDAVVEIDTLVPAFSEDFGSFQDAVPGAFFFLGVSNPEKGWVGMPHSPDYVADEGAIRLGASAMAAILLDFLAAHPR